MPEYIFSCTLRWIEYHECEHCAGHYRVMRIDNDVITAQSVEEAWSLVLKMHTLPDRKNLEVDKESMFGKPRIEILTDDTQIGYNKKKKKSSKKPSKQSIDAQEKGWF